MNMSTGNVFQTYPGLRAAHGGQWGAWEGGRGEGRPWAWWQVALTCSRLEALGFLHWTFGQNELYPPGRAERG